MKPDLESSRSFAMTLAHRAVRDVRRDGFRQLRNYVDMFYIKNVHAHFLRFLPKYIKIISMIANFHDSVKNHCYDRGKGCTSNLEVQPSWGIVFYLDFGQQFLVSPAAALIFRISTAFRIF